MEKVCLFGSYARGEAAENSDMDFIIYGFVNKGMFDMINLCDDFEAKTNKSVDIIRAEHLRDELKRNNFITKRFVRKIKKDLVIVYKST